MPRAVPLIIRDWSSAIPRRSRLGRRAEGRALRLVRRSLGEGGSLGEEGRALRSFSEGGFALLITITLLAFLVLLLVSLASLTRVETQVASNNQQIAQARQNALFALNVALGQLQKTAGPDQRVTARADVDPAAAATNRRWTGVWDSNPASPTYRQRLDWLVSRSDPATPANAAVAVPAPGATSVRLVGENMADLSTPAASDANRVDVPLQELRSDLVPGLAASNQLVGRFGWWVGDEGVKARANLGDPLRTPWFSPTAPKPAPDRADLLNAVGLAQRNAIEWMRDSTAGTGLLDSLMPQSSLATIGRSMSPGQFALAAPAANSAATLLASKARYHDLGFWSAGVQADVRLGGLKRDLTAAFEMPDAAFQSSTFANGATAKISIAPATAGPDYLSPIYNVSKDNTGVALPAGPSGGVYRGPSWHLFRNHYRLYREAGNLSATPSFRARTFLPNDSTGQGAARIPSGYLDLYNGYGYNSTKPDPKTSELLSPTQSVPRPVSPALLPYINRVTYVISLQTVPTSSNLPAGADTTKTLYEVRVVVTPYVVFHNPYNVSLSLGSYEALSAPTSPTNPPGGYWARLELRGIPFSQLVRVVPPGQPATEFPLYGKASAPLIEDRASPLLVAGMNAVSSMGYQNFADVYIPPTVLAPGEVKVFSPPQNTVVPIGRKLSLAVDKNVRGGYYFDHLNGEKKDFFGIIPAADLGKTTPCPIGPGYAPVPLNAQDYRVLVTGDTAVYLSMSECKTGDNSVIIRYSPVSYPGDSTLTTKLPIHSEFYIKNHLTLPSADRPAARAYSAYDNWVDSGGTLASFNGGETAAAYASSVPTPLFAYDIFTKPADHVAAKAVRPFTTTNPMGLLTQKGTEGTYNSYGGKTGFPLTASAWQPSYRRLTGGVASWTTDVMDSDPGTGDAYWGPSNDQADGLTRVSLVEVPVRPMVSLAQFQHLMISLYAHEPYFAVGNSEASPYLDPAKNVLDVKNGSGSNAPSWIFGDVSYLANEALWDGSFFSTLAPGYNASANAYYVAAANAPSPDPDANSRESVRDAWLSGARALPNARMRPYTTPTRAAADLKTSLLDPNLAAGALLTEGSFNVNSRSVEAWVAVLGGARQAAMLSPDANTSVTIADGVAVPRTLPSRAGERGATPVAGEGAWSGYARLTETQVRTLATNLVAQISQRQAANGNRPFLSLAEFINRSLTNDALGRKGALQAAIDASGLNTVVSSQDVTSALQSAANLPFPDNGTGGTASAGSGYVRQADLLQQIGPQLSARSDTFVIRTYGEALNPALGATQGRAWCEAVVQRVPDFIDTSDAALNAIYPGGTLAAGSAAQVSTLNAINTQFGRRFRVVSFRWLSSSDI